VHIAGNVTGNHISHQVSITCVPSTGLNECPIDFEFYKIVVAEGWGGVFVFLTRNTKKDL